MQTGPGICRAEGGNMNGYLYETHMHTSEGSACGQAGGAQMARAYGAGGYAGIIVTDSRKGWAWLIKPPPSCTMAYCSSTVASLI